jgi:uracil phosphoribosyltransferase
MMNILSKTNSLINHFIAEIRDVEIQKDSLRFRENLVRLGELFAYEISKELEFEPKEVVTSLGIAMVPVLKAYPILAAILRAGLPFHQGFLNMFDKSENAFISAYRKYHKDHSFNIQIEYASVPDIEGKTLIICDTMIATGASVVLTYKELVSHGKPLHTYIVSILASQEGLDYLNRNLPRKDMSVWIGTVDDELTAQALIVPGLGDAGDLAFGKKI